MKFPAFRAVHYLLTLGVLALLAGCSKEPDPIQSANEFFADISKGKIDEAYNSAAFAFKASSTPKTFEATARDLGLTAKTVSCTWKETTIHDNEAKLTGAVVSANGANIPVSVTFIQERGLWRLFALHTPKDHGSPAFGATNVFTTVGKGISFNTAATRELPPESVIQRLVEDSLVQFNDAIQRRTFADFYNNISYSWQQQLTLHRLERAFQPFIDKQVNLGPLRGAIPIFDTPPAIDSDGLLVVIGHYPPMPHIVTFSLRYTYELPKWKLLGIDVGMKQ